MKLRKVSPQIHFLPFHVNSIYSINIGLNKKRWQKNFNEKKTKISKYDLKLERIPCTVLNASWKIVSNFVPFIVNFIVRFIYIL